MDPSWAHCEASSVGSSSWLDVADVDELEGWQDAGDSAVFDDGDSSCASFLVVAAEPDCNRWPAQRAAASAAEPCAISWASLAASGSGSGAAPAPAIRMPPLVRQPRRARAGKASDGDEEDDLDMQHEPGAMMRRRGTQAAAWGRRRRR